KPQADFVAMVATYRRRSRRIQDHAHGVNRWLERCEGLDAATVSLALVAAGLLGRFFLLAQPSRLLQQRSLGWRIGHGIPVRADGAVQKLRSYSRGPLDSVRMAILVQPLRLYFIVTVGSRDIDEHESLIGLCR